MSVQELKKGDSFYVLSAGETWKVEKAADQFDGRHVSATNITRDWPDVYMNVGLFGNVRNV
jgi:hypothetical protein